MNRLHQGDLSVGLQPRPNRPEYSTASNSETTAHQFFVPLHYEKNYAYPLLVWLHGPGGTEAEINHVMPHVSLRNFVGVATRGTVEFGPARYGRPAFTWDQSQQCIEQSLDRVLDCVDQAKRRFHIADDRVFLVGNDVGGTMALRLGLLAPQHFAGIVSLGAGLPKTHQPLSGITTARSLPLLIAHCRDSISFDTDDVCDNLRLLHSAGMKVCLRQYPCEQEVTTAMLADVNRWVMEQAVGPTSSDSVEDPSHFRIEERN